MIRYYHAIFAIIIIYTIYAFALMKSFVTPKTKFSVNVALKHNLNIRNSEGTEFHITNKNIRDGRSPVFLFWTRHHEQNFARAMKVLTEKGRIPCEMTNHSFIESADFIVMDPFYLRTNALPTRSSYITRLKEDVKIVMVTYETPSRFKNRGKASLLFPSPNITFWETYFDLIMTVDPYASDIYFPYGRAVPIIYNSTNQTYYQDEGIRDKKLILAIVSNCKVERRMKYIRELKNHIKEMDLYGKCFGAPICLTHVSNKYRGWMANEEECLNRLMSSYKFVISFENSKDCPGYITEKYWNKMAPPSAANGPIPIVGGTSKKTYASLAIPHSYIHVSDFGSSADLANFIRTLADDAEGYKKYKKWGREWKRDQGSVQQWHELCEKARGMVAQSGDVDKSRSREGKISKFQRWWNGCHESF